MATPSHLIIRETKFAKSRLVPLHATAAEVPLNTPLNTEILGVIFQNENAIPLSKDGIFETKARKGSIYDALLWVPR